MDIEERVNGLEKLVNVLFDIANDQQDTIKEMLKLAEVQSKRIDYSRTVKIADYSEPPPPPQEKVRDLGY